MSQNVALELRKYVAEYGRLFGHPVPMIELQHNDLEENLAIVKAAVESGKPVPGWDKIPRSSIVQETAPLSSSPKEATVSTPRQHLERSLERAKKVYGETDPYTRDLQTQLDGMKAADGRSAQQIYFSGRPMSSTKKG